MPTAQEVRDELERRRAQREQEQRSLRVQAAANGQSVTPEAIRRELARRAQVQAERNRPRSVVEEATQGLATLNQGLFMGLGDEVSGAIGGVIDAGGAALSGDFGGIGDAYLQGYERESDRTRQAVDDFRERRPNVAAFTEGTGAAVPVAAALLAGQPQAAAGAYGPAVTRGALTRAAQGRGAGAWAAQTAQGASAGSAYGAVYGAGADDGDWASRLDAANEGAAYGAAFGAAAPTAVNALRGASNLARPAWEATVRAAERIPTPAPNTVGSNAGNLRGPGRSGALQRPPRQTTDQQINFIDRMRDQERMSVDDLEFAFDTARANPQGQRTIDLFNDTGTRTLRPIVQGPGQTSRLAQEAQRERVTEAPGRIMDALRRGLGVGESRHQALARLEGDYRSWSAGQYNRLWNQEQTPQQVALYEQRIAPMLDENYPNREVSTIMRDAVRRAEAQFDLDRQMGIVDGNVTDNLGRYLHYIKGALGDIAQFEATPLRGTSGRRIGSLRQLYRQFADLIDPGGGQPAIVPGYRETSARAGDYFTAREALDEGAAFLNQTPEEVASRVSQMSPFELDHARIGLADEVRTMTRGAVNRNRNVTIALDDPDIQRTLAAAFDSPEQAAEFLSLVNGSGTPGAPGLYRLIDNASQWRGGSSTYANAMHGFDLATQAGVEATANAGSGNMAGAVRTGLNYAQNALTLGMVERANNARGAVALRRIDGPEAKAFADEVIRILREREAMRAGNATASTAAAAQTGGAQASRNERN